MVGQLMYGGCTMMEVGKLYFCFVNGLCRLWYSLAKQLIGYNKIVFNLGLSLIISYILKNRSTWKNCKFRIFGVTNRVECLSEEKNK